MAIVQESWYSGAYYDPDTGVTVSLGADNQTGSWPLTPVGGSGGTSWYISFPYSGYTVYRYARTAPSFITMIMQHWPVGAQPLCIIKIRGHGRLL
jgi:hypothetical protein